MKLVAAKCPNCGANLDVNPKQDATKCEYCHQAILIDDAIAKYKLEISGSVEVKNLPQYDNILKLANRNYNNKEYEEAYKSYDQLLKLDADNTIALLRYGICKKGAKGILVNITASPDIALDDVYIASEMIKNEAHPDALVIWGAAFDNTLEDEMKVTVIATGFDHNSKPVAQQRT